MTEILIDHLASLATTIIGLVCGIPIAFWVNRKIDIRRQRDEASRILSVFKDEIDHNISILNQMLQKSKSIFFYNLRLTFWEVFSRKLEIIENNDLVSHLARLYFKYQYLSEEIDKAVKEGYVLDKEIMEDYIPKLTVMSKELLTEIDTELSS